MRKLKSVYLLVFATLLSLVPFSEMRSAEPESVETRENETVKAEAPATPVYIRLRRASVPSNVVRLNFGPNWMLSRVETADGSYSGELTMALTAEYTHYWRSGLGLGITMDYGSFYFDRNSDLSMIYAAPTLAYSWQPARKFLMELAGGVGMVYYAHDWHDDDWRHHSDSDVNLGFHTRFGVEYMLTSRFGLGGEINTLTSFYPDSRRWLKNSPGAFFRLGFVTGVRFYF